MQKEVPPRVVLPPELEHLQEGFDECTLSEEEYTSLKKYKSSTDYSWQYVLRHIAIVQPRYEGRRLVGSCSNCWEVVVFRDGEGTLTDTEADSDEERQLRVNPPTRGKANGGKGGFSGGRGRDGRGGRGSNSKTKNASDDVDVDVKPTKKEDDFVVGVAPEDVKKKKGRRRAKRSGGFKEEPIKFAFEIDDDVNNRADDKDAATERKAKAQRQPRKRNN